MADLTLGQSDISIVVSDTTGNIALINTSSDSGNSLTVFESSRGQKVASNSIPVVVCDEQSVRNNFLTGQVIIGLTAVQLPSNALKNSINIKSSDYNTGILYVGSSNTVTTATGYELSAGESITLPINNSNLIYLISDSTNQIISYIAS
jgi:hypothetical protein